MFINEVTENYTSVKTLAKQNFNNFKLIFAFRVLNIDVVYNYQFNKTF